MIFSGPSIVTARESHYGILVPALNEQPVPSRPPSKPGLVGRASQKQLAMYVLFGTLSMLFGASIVGYLITRAQNVVWKTSSMPSLPLGLWGSTALIALLSAAMHRALAEVRQNHFEALQRALGLALLLAAAFVVGQSLNWRSMYAGNQLAEERTLYAFTFYMLTGLHAAHVVGGVVPLSIVLGKARRREYTSSSYEGIKLCAQYWDYLGLVWAVLLGVLYLKT
ncbi:MAG TPA: cytochrome c oxidase subunit 3 [Polyangiaceae bacterium]|jgi:cytochrome c oxidase subunit 3